MTDQEPKTALFRIFAYSPDDEKLYAYIFTEEKLQEAATTFHRDIFFMMTDEEILAYEDPEADQVDNLKNDFIYYNASVEGNSYWECTCGNFLETDRKGEDRMVKRTLAHARKTGHALHPRGN